MNTTHRATLSALALAAATGVHAQTTAPLIIDGDTVQRTVGIINASEILLRDRARLELDGGFSFPDDADPRLRLQDQATADLRHDPTTNIFFGVIETDDSAQLVLTGVPAPPTNGRIRRSGAGAIDVGGSSRIDATDIGLNGNRISSQIRDQGTVYAVRSDVGGESITVQDSGRLIAIDSTVAPLTVRDQARVELINGIYRGTADMSGILILDQASLLVDGFNFNPNGGSYSFSGQSTGLFIGDNVVSDTNFITLRDESQVKIEDGRFITESGFDPSNGGFQIKDEAVLTFAGGTVAYPSGTPTRWPGTLFNVEDQGTLVLEGGTIAEDPEAIRRFSEAVADPDFVFRGAERAVVEGPGFIDAPLIYPALSLFDQSELILSTDSASINGQAFDLGEADTLALTDLPEFGVLSAMLADGNLLEVSFVREADTRITLRRPDATPPEVVPTPTALSGGLLLAAGLLRRRRGA